MEYFIVTDDVQYDSSTGLFYALFLANR